MWRTVKAGYAILPVFGQDDKTSLQALSLGSLLTCLYSKGGLQGIQASSNAAIVAVHKAKLLACSFPKSSRWFLEAFARMQVDVVGRSQAQPATAAQPARSGKPGRVCQGMQ